MDVQRAEAAGVQRGGRPSTERGDLLSGFGDGLGFAVELALTPVLFGGLGYLLDRWLGTVPVFMIVFLVVSIVAKFVVMWARYDAQMKAEEARAPWASARPSRRPAA